MRCQTLFLSPSPLDKKSRSTVSSPIFFKSCSSRSLLPLSLDVDSPFANTRAALSTNSFLHLWI